MIEIVTTAYTDKMFIHAYTLLSSLKDVYGDGVAVTVAIGGMSLDKEKRLTSTFKNVSFCPITLETSRRDNVYLNKFHSFSSRRRLSSMVAMVDCDTIFLKKVDELFNYDFDVVYTYRDHDMTGDCPINGGVVLCKISPKVEEFFTLWENRTREVRRGEVLLKGHTLQGDQEVMCDYLGGADRVRTLEDITVGDVKFKGLPCSLLNCIEGAPRSDTYIVHLKGLIKGPRIKVNQDLWNKYSKGAV